jgi:hypothetical protein
MMGRLPGWRLGSRWAWVWLAVLPALVNAPALSGRFRYDPLYVLSGVTTGTWTTNGILPGMPWIDGNVGTTTQALGTLVAHDWLSGTLPWWNPYSGVGLPLAAEGQNPAFFLPFVLLLALPHGLLLLHLTLMALAGLFSYALLRRLHIDTLPALTAACLFELNGTFAWLGHGPVMPVAFLPLVLLGLEVSRTRFSVALAMGVAWTLAAGFPETAALNLLFAAVWGMMRLRVAADPVAYARRAGSSALCGVLLSLPATWPFLEALPREFLGVHAGSIATTLLPANLALQVFPGVLGAPMAGPMVLGQSDRLWMGVGGSTDIVLVMLALAGFRWRARHRDARIAIAAWLLITGARAWGVKPIVWLCGLVPFFDKANLHLYCVPSWSMALAVLAAFALQDWRDGRTIAWRGIAFAVVAVGALALVMAGPQIGDLWRRLPGFRLLLPLVLGVPLVAAIGVLVAWRGGWTRRRERMVSVGILANASLLFTIPLFAGTHGRYIDDGAIRYLQTYGGFARVWSIGPLVPNYGAMFGIAAIGHNYLPVPRSWVAYERDRLMGGPDGVNFYPGWPATAPELAPMLPAYAKAGVGFLVVQSGVMPFPPRDAHGLRLAYHGTLMDVWSVLDVAPYWRADGCTLAAQSRTGLVAHCAHPATLRRLELSWPGWSANVAGQNAQITTTEEIFQSVALPAGTSQVTFDYAPPWAWLAWIGCFVGAVSLSSSFLKKRTKKLL